MRKITSIYYIHAQEISTSDSVPQIKKILLFSFGHDIYDRNHRPFANAVQAELRSKQLQCV